MFCLRQTGAIVNNKPFLPLLILLTLGAALFAQGSTKVGDLARAGDFRLSVTELDAAEPFQVSAVAHEQQLSIEVRLEPGWHMYGRDAGKGPPVAITILQGSCFEAAGAPVIPMDAEGEIKGKTTITLPLRRTRSGNSLKARFSYMVCDALECKAPAEFTLERSHSASKPLTVLLITSDDKSRSDRIQEFLQKAGFTCKVTQYAAVTKAECEAHDLVVYDSPCSDQDTWRTVSRAGRKHAAEFPKIKTPLIAVGFLGTELLDAHRLAIACGYI